MKSYVAPAMVRTLMGQVLLDNLRQPVILATPSGEVVHANPAMQDLLSRSTLVAVRDGRLWLPPRQLDDWLDGCAELVQMAAGREADSIPHATRPASFRSLQLRDKGAGGGPVHVFFTLLGARGGSGPAAEQPLVMLVFYHPASASPINAGLLSSVFGLTPAEARIASMLAEGHTLKAIAQQQGTQHETVRKQLRSIYLKTATNRQPDLVRLLLQLPHTVVHV